MHALILAGGFATRLWPLTEKIAKPLVPLAGRPLVSYMVEKIPNSIPITISTNQVFANDFEEWKKSFPEKKIDIFVEDSSEETQKKGALAATALCIQEKNIEEDLLLLAGDNFFGFNFESFLSCASVSPLLAAYDVQEKSVAKSFGVVVPSMNEEGRVEEFEEKPENPKSTFVSTGAYIFPKKFLHHIVEYSKENADDLGGIFEYCMQQGEKVFFFSFSESWHDIGSFSAFLKANEEVLNGKNIIHSSVKQQCSSFVKNIVVEEDVQIENSTLENCTIQAGSRIKNCRITDCVIGKNCILEQREFSRKIVRDETVSLV